MQSWICASIIWTPSALIEECKFDVQIVIINIQFLQYFQYLQEWGFTQLHFYNEYAITKTAKEKSLWNVIHLEGILVSPDHMAL